MAERSAFLKLLAKDGSAVKGWSRDSGPGWIPLISAAFRVDAPIDTARPHTTTHVWKEVFLKADLTEIDFPKLVEIFTKNIGVTATLVLVPAGAKEGQSFIFSGGSIKELRRNVEQVSFTIIYTAITPGRATPH